MNKKMATRCSGFILSGTLSLLLAAESTVAQAEPGWHIPKPLVHAKRYSALAADWLEWVVAIPAASNPLLDPTGAFAAEDQSGNVWFLAGTLGGQASRSVTVPEGTALFFPIVNYFWVNTPEYGDPAWSPAQEAVARGYLAERVDTAHDLVLKIDGQPARNGTSLRMKSAVGDCTVPPSADDNIFEVALDAGPHPCVADGYWAFLPPLSVGHHTIRLAGGLFAADGSEVTVDVTYQVTVWRHRPRMETNPM